MSREIDNLVDSWSNEDNFFEPSSTYVETDPTKKVYRPEGTPDPREVAHATLATAGMAPVIGNIADVVDAALYAKEGKFKDMAISLLGAIPFLGQLTGAKKIAKLTKEIKAVARIKKIAKFERMEEAMNKGDLLFANSKWQKQIDKGDLEIKKGYLWTRMPGSDAPLLRTFKLDEMPKWDRFSDYYKMMKDLTIDAEKVIKKMSPKELKQSIAIQKNPKAAEELRETILKLDELLKKGD